MRRLVGTLAALAATALAATLVPLGSPALGSPALGSPALGSPALGTPALGTPALGTPALATAEPDGAFRPLPGFRPSGDRVRVEPRAFTAVAVDTGQIRAQLQGAPQRGDAGATVFRIPTPSGGAERFAVQRTQVMQAGLAAAHPELQTWSGVSLDNPGTTAAIDVTPMGFHASVRGPNGRHPWYVDPAYNKPGTTAHLAYYGRSLPADAKRPTETELPRLKRAIDSRLAAGEPAVTRRTYRLALVSDPTYADYFGSANVLAEKVTLINRVNQLYNDDLAIRLVLVDGTDKLNFDTVEKAAGPNGPCGTHPCWTLDPDSPTYVEGQLSYCDVGTLQRNQTVLGQLIGAANYDLGHVALGTNGGGIAGLGVVGSVEKAMGCTGIPDPVGDFYAIDYVAHEVGHQFGGNHTFNGVRWACSGGNRNGPTSVEPGSGSSIMAYPGICTSDDLQPHSDPYFSQRSLTEINRYVSGSALEPIEVQDVSLSGFDADGDALTIDYPGATADPVTLTRGSTYTAAGVEAAVEALTGVDVTVGKWGYDPYAGIYSDPFVYPAPLGEADDAGFQVMFAGDADPYTADSDRLDMKALIVTPSAGVTVTVGESAQGGPPGNGGDSQVTGNRAPVVTAPADRTIPIRTPFTLSGKATDADGDSLTYLWEQNDAGRGGGTPLTSNMKTNGPLFRVFGTFADVSDEAALLSPSPGQNLAGGVPSRTFPDLAQVLRGNTNAVTGFCRRPPQGATTVARRLVDCFSEFLPTAAYADRMHFRLTARDVVPGGGGVGFDDVTLRVARHAGPFLVTSFEKGGRVEGGTRRPITWKVNGTQRLARNVSIVLSTDNGETWGRVLVGKTRNDGRAVVRFPDVTAGKAWVRIEARGNYFFDVNAKSFAIR